MYKKITIKNIIIKSVKNLFPISKSKRNVRYRKIRTKSLKRTKFMKYPDEKSYTVEFKREIPANDQNYNLILQSKWRKTHSRSGLEWNYYRNS